MAVLLSLTAASEAASQAINLNDLRFELVVERVNRPVAITHAGDGSGRLFITQQRGLILIYDGERLLERPFLDIETRVRCCGERGLLSVAFHPDYENNGRFFVNYTDHSGATVVARYSVTQDPNVADADSEAVVLTIPQPFDNHNGGQLQFGPDGFLYIGMGDGGSGQDPGNRAQNLQTLLGKILRIDVDNGEPFAVPPDNPFVNQPPFRAEIWALGLRNPWRFSFDRATGDMFIGDVGQSSVEEIDFQSAGRGGLNYGWRRMEGGQCLIPASGCNDGTLTLPIFQYSRPAGRCGGSVTGGYRYRGRNYPQLDGVYFYADFCTGRLFAGVEEVSGWRSIGPRQTEFSFSTFGEDERGELYFAHYSPAGTIYRVTTDFPAPSISSLSPRSVVAAGAGFVLGVVGANFVPGSEVRWNGEPRPTTFLDKNRLQAEISGDDILLSAMAEVTVFTPAPGGGVTEEQRNENEPEPSLTPSNKPRGVVNAASFREAVSPGSIASVFGVDLAVRSETSAVDPLPAALGGATLIFEGSIPVPQFFASPRQSNVQIPWELSGKREASLIVRIGGAASEAARVALSDFSPGIFSMDQSGGGQGAILISGTGALAAPRGFAANSRPIGQGEFLEIFATGLGAVTNTPADGFAALANPISESLVKPSVRIANVEANVLFSGLAPGFVGLYQVNADLPQAVPSGPNVPVSLILGEVESNSVSIAVE